MESLHNKAAAYHHLGDFENALKTLDRGIEFYPKEANFYYARAIVYISLQKFEKAKKDLDQAILLNPEKKEFYQQLIKDYEMINNTSQ